MTGAPRRLTSDADLGAALALIRESFAYMDGVIDPPSSMHRLTVESLRAAAEDPGELWGIGRPPDACALLARKGPALCIGKLAVRAGRRGTGLARRILELAEERARAVGCGCLELQTRIELVGNHRTFAALGFEVCGETAHPGYDRTTSLTMRRAVPAAPPGPFVAG